jgi:hypothetical protein
MKLAFKHLRKRRYGEDVPITQASRSHEQICFEAFETEPGFVCAPNLVMRAHNSKDESEMLDGAFKFIVVSIELVVPATTE